MATDDLKFALSFEGEDEMGLIVLPETLGPDYLFEYISGTLEGETITAFDIVAANAGSAETVIAEGELSDIDGNIFFLRKAGADHWVLYITQASKPLPPDPAEDGDAITITQEAYRAHLVMYVRKLEKIRYFASVSGRLHGEAVQDAVDIVQTKRIDFSQTKKEGLDVAGVLSVAVAFVLFETGAGAFILSRMFAHVASRLSAAAFAKKVMGMVFRLAGRASGKSKIQPRILELNARIEKLSAEFDRMIKQADRLILEGKDLPQELFIASEKKRKEFRPKIRKKENAIGNAKKEREALEGELKEELLKIGKKTVDEKIRSGKAKLAGKAGAIQGAAEKGIGKATDTLFKDAAVQDPTPLDIYFKTAIRDFYEEPVMVTDRMIDLIKDMLAAVECFGISSGEELAVHQQALDELPAIEELDGILEEYAELFGESFSFSETKSYQVREYEFIIWTLLLQNKIRFEINPIHIVRPFTRQLNELVNTVMDTPGKGHVPPYINQTMDIEDDFAKYLSIRFQLDNTKESISKAILESYAQLMQTVAFVNQSLVKTGEKAYHIDLINSPLKGIDVEIPT